MKKKIAALVLMCGAMVLFASPDKSADFVKITENCYFYKLENGLSLFVAENHSVPLAYVEIAVRAGAVTQTKENAGLFHLYEHMMFKGNKKFSNSAKVQKALSDMGTASWNGSTGIECVNYYFTIPKQRLADGLDFWNNAVRFPLLDRAELEAEKKVVISEIQGHTSEPERYIGAFLNSHLFDKPWQLDPSGSVQTVSNATVEQLKEIQAAFYVPQNAALFVGGDVEHADVFRLVNDIYGDWQGGSVSTEEIEAASETQNATPFEKPLYCVFPYDKVPEQLAQIELFYRGPDCDFDEEATYCADLLSYMMNDPKSEFVMTFTQDADLKIPGSEYIGTGYSTRRRSGIISASAMVVEPEKNLAERSVRFRNLFDSFMEQYLHNSDIVPSKTRKDIVRRLNDDTVFASETFSGMLSTLRYHWVSNSIAYYQNYISNVGNAKNGDIQRYIKQYIAGKNPLVIVLVNPAVYEKTKDDFSSLGFTEINSQNSFWWSK